MAVVGKLRKPGEQAPLGGLYECDGGCDHTFSTERDSHVLPPLPDDCVGGAWRLVHAHPDYSMGDHLGLS
ncbi:hypothetical protein HUO13_18050 [Saccharopolyspora erythraea]|uniref:hypothetical protein n=1 Tax=Saccharopolyspora erythraea TaxID=1836 RepID=UPI001BACCFCF|nr:hypothetical protein [Saccharopolyspora erythraea]QUH02452.1 hypothetical protein HUO13_18050 [Saccharopolyspora erythraea]